MNLKLCKDVSDDLVVDKQNMHRIGYMVNGLSASMCVKSNIISFDNGSVNRDLVMGILLRKYPANTKLILLSITDLGLQNTQ